MLLLVIGCAAAASDAAAPTLSVAERLVAGGTARAISQLALFPVDALRTHAQTRAGSAMLRDLGVRRLVSGAGTTSAFAYGIGALQFDARLAEDSFG